MFYTHWTNFKDEMLVVVYETHELFFNFRGINNASVGTFIVARKDIVLLTVCFILLTMLFSGICAEMSVFILKKVLESPY